MGKLLYAITTSLDGYVADSKGNFDWAMPSEEVHSFFNGIVQNVGTSLMGRKMYDVMKVWEEMPESDSPAMNDYAKQWHTTNKIIYSTTLQNLAIANATIERSFDAEAIRALLRESDKDIDIGGPGIAAAAIRAGLVDEYHQVIAPVIVGEGTYWLPQGVHSELKLFDTRSFDNGFVYIRYGKEA